MIKSILKRIFPRKWLQKAKAKLVTIDNHIAVFLSCSRLGSQLYYFLLNRSFVREQFTTLQGRAKYLRDNGVAANRYVRLRRNIHRLEKGLIMQPRRDVFGLDYIAETVVDFSRYAQDTNRDAAIDEPNWFYDVLCDYFQTVDQSHPVIAAAKQQFEQVAVFNESQQADSQQQHSYIDADAVISENFIPYPQTELLRADVEFEQLMKLVKQRRSVRWFHPQPVDSELLLKAVDLARFAPSACNRQPFKFVIANRADKASTLLKLAMGTVGFAQQVPCAIAVVGDLASYEAERDRHLIYIDASLAAMQLMLALETLGLSSCPINWPDIEQREVKITQHLNLSSTQRPVMLMAIGYADGSGKIPYSQKCSAEQLSTFI